MALYPAKFPLLAQNPVPSHSISCQDSERDEYAYTLSPLDKIREDSGLGSSSSQSFGSFPPTKPLSPSPIKVKLWHSAKGVEIDIPPNIKNIANGCIKNLETYDTFIINKFEKHPVLTFNHQIDACLEWENIKDDGNAYWDPVKSKLFFTKILDTSPYREHALSQDLGVVGHELGHAYIQYYSGGGGLDYVDQSGALNESIADVFGIMTQHYRRNSKANQEDADWTIGKGIYTKNPDHALRSMEAPGSANPDDEQPNHADQYKKKPHSDDNGGVHTNSGIPNRAFYIAAKELQEECWKRAGTIWTIALEKSKANEKFAGFAQLTCKAAKNKYGSEEENLVRKAWHKVGVIPGVETIEIKTFSERGWALAYKAWDYKYYGGAALVASFAAYKGYDLMRESIKS